MKLGSEVRSIGVRPVLSMPSLDNFDDELRPVRSGSVPQDASQNA